MPERIQRVPQGLLNVIGAFGGQVPGELGGSVLGTLDLLQMYGLQQLQVLSASDAALAETGQVAITLPNTWSVLFAVAFNLTKTATMTALRARIDIVRGSASPQVGRVSQDLGPFGATETGTVQVNFIPPYPLLLPPASRIGGTMTILGTDATAATSIQAEIGLLG
jgi:hypothetical protein